MDEYINAFIIGSSWPVFISFFLVVGRMEKNYSYETYTLLAPFMIGLFNVLSLVLAKHFKLSTRNRFILIGVLAPLIVFCISYTTGSYTNTTPEWLSYFALLFLQYFLVFNVIIYMLHKHSRIPKPTKPTQVKKNILVY